MPDSRRRYLAVHLFERDEATAAQAKLPAQAAARVEALVARCERDCDDDAESIIASERYAQIAHLMTNA